jgi:hypothetical protein
MVNPPSGFVLDSPTSDDASAEAVILFVTDRRQLEADANSILEPARHDRLAWIAYPRAGQLGTDLNRDVVRERVLEGGVQPVRQVAIDDTWSALRLRPV